jgi:hypothetical protein
VWLLQAEVRTLERVSERIKDGIRDIDARATRISQTATRVGDRLQVRIALQPSQHHLHLTSSSGVVVLQPRSICLAAISAGSHQAHRQLTHLPCALPANSCRSLQTAEGLRLRCLEAQELISHLQAFSCHSAGEDFSKLPPIFTNDATLAEAAVSQQCCWQCWGLPTVQGDSFVRKGRVSADVVAACFQEHGGCVVAGNAKKMRRG